MIRDCVQRAYAGLFALAVTILVSGPPAFGQAIVELHLVLAFDVSASINDEEFDLQRSGLARAFRDPAVQTAIAKAPGGIAVSIIQWSSISRQALGLNWTKLDDAASTEAFADAVDAMPRLLPGGGTMIHAGLAFAARMLDDAPGWARRRVIDVSGNGVSDDLEKTREQRDLIVASGVTINGLAIEELKQNLTAYYREDVIGGNDAFVITAMDFEDFQEAMQRKLLREISGSLSAQGRGAGGCACLSPSF